MEHETSLASNRQAWNSYQRVSKNLITIGVLIALPVLAVFGLTNNYCPDNPENIYCKTVGKHMMPPTGSSEQIAAKAQKTWKGAEVATRSVTEKTETVAEQAKVVAGRALDRAKDGVDVVQEKAQQGWITARNWTVRSVESSRVGLCKYTAQFCSPASAPQPGK